MMHRRLSRGGGYTSAALFAVALSTGAAAGGCSGDVAPGGSGATDGGTDAPGACTAADCAGLAAPALAKACPGGTSVGATLCERQASGPCDWGFPACPDDAGPACRALGCFPQCPGGVLKDSNGCDTCQCAPPADGGGSGACTSNTDCPNGGVCAFLESAGCAANGQCFPAPVGARCAIASTVGCGCHGSDVSIDPSCYSGLPNGYQSKPVLHEGACMDAGGGCVSQRGGPCGGNTARPCTCASGLTCTPGDGGLPFGDVGGSCE
jgi:antistasin family protein